MSQPQWHGGSHCGAVPQHHPVPQVPCRVPPGPGSLAVGLQEHLLQDTGVAFTESLRNFGFQPESSSNQEKKKTLLCSLVLHTAGKDELWSCRWCRQPPGHGSAPEQAEIPAYKVFPAERGDLPRGAKQGLPRQLTEHLREPTVFLHSLLCKNKVNNSCNLGNKMEKA